MNVIYFAWLKEKIGIATEQVLLPHEAYNVADLVSDLKTRGGGYEDAFENIAIVRVAVNQDHVNFDHVLKDGDEVAFFPPVTGG